MKFILVLFFSFCLVSSNAQLLDSIQDCFKYKPKPLFKMDARNAFVTSGFVKVKGIKVGLSHHKRVRYGVGYSWMKTDYFIINNLDSTNLRFSYANLFFEYAFFKSKNWQLEIPIQVGFGRISYQDLESNLLQKQWVPIWEPAMTFEYLFLKYFGIGAGVGYRLVFKSKTPISEKFTSPIYIFRFKIYFDQLYKDMK